MIFITIDDMVDVTVSSGLQLSRSHIQYFVCVIAIKYLWSLDKRNTEGMGGNMPKLFCFQGWGKGGRK